MTNFLLRRFVPDYQNTADPAVREKYGNLAGIVGIICNVLLFAGKLLAGTLCGSVSVTADAVNNLSDASSSLVTLLGFRLAARPADEKHPYGHARMEYLSGLAVAVMILVIGVELVKSSVQKILHPEAVEFSVLTAAVLTGSILLKLWMALFDRKLGKKIGSAALTAAAADSRSDVISTGAVLLACVVGRLTGLMIDGWAGLLVALFILWSGVGVVKDTVDPLLGAKPDEALVRAIAYLMTSHVDILGFHDLMVHDYGPAAALPASMPRSTTASTRLLPMRFWTRSSGRQSGSCTLISSSTMTPSSPTTRRSPPCARAFCRSCTARPAPVPSRFPHGLRVASCERHFRHGAPAGGCTNRRAAASADRSAAAGRKKDVSSDRHVRHGGLQRAFDGGGRAAVPVSGRLLVPPLLYTYHIWISCFVMLRAMLQLNYKPPEMLDETGAVR